MYNARIKLVVTNCLNNEDNKYKKIDECPARKVHVVEDCVIPMWKLLTGKGLTYSGFKCNKKALP